MDGERIDLAGGGTNWRDPIVAQVKKEMKIFAVQFANNVSDQRHDDG